MNRFASTLEQKIEWLLSHRIFLVGELDLKKVALAMKHDGLLAKSTYWPDAKTGIEEAVKQAKFRWYAEHNGREIKV
jgi:hypothetical protein